MGIFVKERLVLWVALTLIVISTLYPPIQVTASYQSSSGVPSFHREIRYDFLFTSTVKNIHYGRLFFQYLMIFVISFCIIAMPFFISKVTMNHSWQQISKLTLENKCLQDEVNALHQANEKSKKQQFHLEKPLKQQDSELASAKEARKRQITESSRDKDLLSEQEPTHGSNEKKQHKIGSEDLEESKAKTKRRSTIIKPLDEKKLKELSELLKRLT